MKMIREWINTLLAQWGMQTETVGWMERIVIIAIILLIAFLADLICRRIIVEGIKRLTKRTRATWDDLVFNDKVLNNFCHIIPPVLIYILMPLAFPDTPGILAFLLKICMVYIIAVALKFVNVFLGVLFELTNQKKEFRDRPLKGVYQIVQVGLFFVGTILIISILINKSPIHLFVGCYPDVGV